MESAADVVPSCLYALQARQIIIVRQRHEDPGKGIARHERIAWL